MHTIVYIGVKSAKMHTIVCIVSAIADTRFLNAKM
jgi:hypothetical protein